MDELGLLDYLEACWRRRWWVAAMALLSPLAAAAALTAQPSRYEAEATLALTPPAFAQRVALLVVWDALPVGLLSPGQEARVRRQDELVRLTVVASSPAGAEVVIGRLLAWVATERRAPDRPTPDRPAKLPRPSLEQVAGWRGQLRDLEARLPRFPPTAASYWTVRALSLHDRIEAALAPESPEPKPLELKGEEAVTLQRPGARQVPRPWLEVLGAAALSGFVVPGVMGALIHEWWRREMARRETARRP